MNLHREREFYETAVHELALAAGDFRSTLAGIDDRPRAELRDLRFANARGKLPLPLDGRIVRTGPSGNGEGAEPRKGVFLEGEGSPEVRSVFSGRVDFSGG